MGKRLVGFMFVTLLVGTLLFAGCQREKQDSKLMIGVSIRGLDNPYYVQIKEGAEIFAQSMFEEGEYEIQVMESQGSDDKQINDVKAFLARSGGNAILYVDPNNFPNAAVIAEMCEDAEVYWNTTWSYADGVYPMDYEYYVMHQTADNATGGYETAKAMFQSFDTPGKGKIVAVLGMITNDASIGREEGLRKALAEYPDVELLDIQPGNWSPQEALTLTQTWLAKYGDDLDGVWVANDSMALAVTEGLRAAGLNGKVKVTGFDCIDDILGAIAAGDVYATFSSNPYLQAGYGLGYSYAAYTGKIKTSELPGEMRMIKTKGVLVSSDNLKAYQAEFVTGKPVYDYTNLEYAISQPFDLNNLK